MNTGKMPAAVESESEDRHESGVNRDGRFHHLTRKNLRVQGQAGRPFGIAMKAEQAVALAAANATMQQPVTGKRTA